MTLQSAQHLLHMSLGLGVTYIAARHDLCAACVASLHQHALLLEEGTRTRMRSMWLLQEDVELPYKSTHAGRMHACAPLFLNATDAATPQSTGSGCIMS